MSLTIVASSPPSIQEAEPLLLRSITPAGHAWLNAYDVARGFGFAKPVAQRQAFAAADRLRDIAW